MLFKVMISVHPSDFVESPERNLHVDFRSVSLLLKAMINLLVLTSAENSVRNIFN